MKDVLGRWRSPRAEREFRRLEDELWADLFPGGVRSSDVATAFGATRAYRWDGAGTPVVLLHGIGGTSLMWAPYVGRWGNRGVVAIDTMGDVGRSVHEKAFVDRADVARWLGETLDGLGIEIAHLVGTSYGAWLALNLALHRPERVASLTLIEPVGLGGFNMAGFLRWGLAVFAASALPASLRTRASARLRMPALTDRRVIRLALKAQTGHSFRPRPTECTEEELRSVTAPTLVLIGGKSAIHDADEVADVARRNFRDPTVIVVPDAGHALSLSHVDVVEQAWCSARLNDRKQPSAEDS